MDNQYYEERSTHEGMSVVVFIGVIIAMMGILGSLFFILSINRDMTPNGLSGIKGDYEYPFTEYESSQLLKLAASNLIFIAGMTIAFLGKKVKNAIIAICVPLGIVTVLILIFKALLISEFYTDSGKQYENSKYNTYNSFQDADNIENGVFFETADRINDAAVSQESDYFQGTDSTKNEINQQDISMRRGYKNIALFSKDFWSGNPNDENICSDTIVITSINLDTDEIRLVSVERNAWMNMSNDTYGKARGAYARGGVMMAISMLNMNLDLDITDFITIGFDGLIDVIDAVGGIEVNVTDEEISYLNANQIRLIGEEDGTYNEGYEANYYVPEGISWTPVTYSGMQTLNGTQAVAYSHKWYQGDSRGSMQRYQTILKQLINKMAQLDNTKIMNIADIIFDNAVMSFEQEELRSLLKDTPYYRVNEATSFPFEGHKENVKIEHQIVVAATDLTTNVSLLHEFLFGEKKYDPSSTVKKCSKQIMLDVEKYHEESDKDNKDVVSDNGYYSCSLVIQAPDDYIGGNVEVILFTVDGKQLWYSQDVTSFPVSIDLDSFESPSAYGIVIITYLKNQEEFVTDESGRQTTKVSSVPAQIRQNVQFTRN